MPEEAGKAAISAGDMLIGSVLTVPLPVIRRASHAMGLEFYDGVIDIETESNEMPLIRRDMSLQTLVTRVTC